MSEINKNNILLHNTLHEVVKKRDNNRVENNSVSLVKADINKEDKYKRTPLHWAVVGENIKLVKSLLENGANTNKKDDMDNTPLQYAVGDGNIEIVKLLLKNGANTNNTSLHWAAGNGDVEMVKLLLENRANINGENEYKFTPLYYTTNIEMIKFLLENGADVNHKNKNGETPLMWGIHNKWDHKVLEFLLKNGATI